MMVIRPVERGDIAALMQLAGKTGGGLTSLPADEKTLSARIERALQTWQGTLPKSEQGYVFVLEDTDTGTVAGICAIEVAVGLNDPWYNYRVGTMVHASKELNVYNALPTLFLCNDHTGASELCTLFLDPAWRKEGNGYLLSKSRFMFMAAFRDRFNEKVVAEMRGVIDDTGYSPFWESLGERFFSMEFSRADYLCGTGQKAFIAELMPKHPIYTHFLSPQAQAVIDRLGAHFKATDLVMRLTIAEQQQVEIARALHRNSRILVMDEPTAALSSRETHRLFELILRLREEGMAIIYISHRMAEVYELSDRVSVLRDGQYVGSLTRDKLNASELVKMMVGRPLSDLFNKERDIPLGSPRLNVHHLTDGKKVLPCSLQVRSGEIVGLAGLVGAGRSELAQLIFGARKATGGMIEVDGEPVVIHSPRAAIDNGIGFLTENRKEQGLFLELAAQENITMATLERDATFGMLNRKKAQTISDDAIALLNIRVPHSQVRAGGLSGGNQQKLLISRWVAIGPRILILDEPTRGVDVGAKSEIYRIMNQMARKGVAILMISSELPEIVGMSDRVYVMREGSIAGELHGAEISQENIMTLATGVNDSHHQAVQL